MGTIARIAFAVLSVFAVALALYLWLGLVPMLWTMGTLMIGSVVVDLGFSWLRRRGLARGYRTAKRRERW